MLDSLTSRQAAEILALAQEPIGEERADFRAAQICLHIAAAAGVKDPVLEDYLLRFAETEPPAPDPKLLRQKTMFVFAALIARGVPLIKD